MAFSLFLITAIYFSLIFFGAPFIRALPFFKYSFEELLVEGAIFGLAFLGIIIGCLYGINLSLEIKLIFVLSTSLIMNILVESYRIHIEFKKIFQKKNLFIAIFIGILIILLLFPGGNFHLVPWRIGPDAAGYSAVAEYLLKNRNLLPYEGSFTNPVDMYAFVFLDQVKRYTFPTLIAFVSLLTRSHPVEVIFPFVCLCYALIGILVFRINYSFNKFSPGFSMLLAYAVVMNCNMLFIFYEGCYPQIVILPIISLLVFFSIIGINELNFKKIISYSILFVGASSFYLESPILLIPILGILYILNFRFKNLKYILLFILVSISLSFNLIKEIVIFQIENIRVLSLAGWPQPRWAYLVQIIGLDNIYSNVIGNNPGYLIAEDSINYNNEIIINVLIMVFIATCARRDNFYKLFFTIIAVIASFLYYFKELKLVHSYAYMKIYTSYIPIIFISIFSITLKGVLKKYYLYLLATLAVLIIYTGLIFQNSYMKNYFHVSAGMTELRDLRDILPKGSVVMIPGESSPDHLIKSIFIRSIMDMPMIHNEYFASQDFHDYLDSEVLILMNNLNYQPLDPGAVIWSGQDYSIVQTGLPLKMAWKNLIPLVNAPYKYDTSRPEIELKFAKYNLQDAVKNSYDLNIFTNSSIQLKK